MAQSEPGRWHTGACREVEMAVPAEVYLRELMTTGRLVAAVLLAFLAPAIARGQVTSVATPKPLDLEELVSRMMEADRARTAALKNYSSLRLYALENKRFGTSAEIRVRMTFQPPHQKAFEIVSEKGSGIIRRRVLRRLIQAELDTASEKNRGATEITTANYAFHLAGTRTYQDRVYYLLEAVPNRQDKYLFRGRIWIDPEDFAIARIEGSPAQNASFFIKKTTFVHLYRKFGQFWLPVSNRSETDVRIFGRTSVTVEYSEYRVNADQPPALTHRVTKWPNDTGGEAAGHGERTESKP